MKADLEIKQQVRDFYDQVGWRQVSEGVYQNARYEDLRPVSREYIHRCHMRVRRHLAVKGDMLLDAGSGPIQYPEYLTYSEGYRYRLCLDISIVALQEARNRIGVHGLYVVGDIAYLPLKGGSMDGIVSLHTVHHLPFEQQPAAYRELFRVLRAGRSAVVVNGWKDSRIMKNLRWCMTAMEFCMGMVKRLASPRPAPPQESEPAVSTGRQPTGTYAQHLNAFTLQQALSESGIPAGIRVWRSVSTRFLRTVIHPRLAGRLCLRLLFWLEERFPFYFGRHGQYPLVVIRKPGMESEA